MREGEKDAAAWMGGAMEEELEGEGAERQGRESGQKLHEGRGAI